MIKAEKREKSGSSGLRKKARPGRPRLGEGKKGTQSPFIGLRLPPDEIGKIDALADREGVKRSEMVRRLLLIGIAAYSPGKRAK